ncbi:MAG: hypothetical protein JRG83_13385 [Deltaproteobacteria bacterium]|nr:hypothetical protein [Deltaproteobacteria bacterium]
MARIPEDTLQAIRDRVDLVDLIGRHVHLKKSGRNFVGLCPFHTEKSPSFNVNIEKQIYHCFGCGEGGNAITFLMQHENLTFPEAARTLARDLGIEIPENEAPGEAGLSERLRAANQVAQDLYAEALGKPQAEPAREYLARRGLGQEEIDLFGIPPAAAPCSAAWSARRSRSRSASRRASSASASATSTCCAAGSRSRSRMRGGRCWVLAAGRCPTSRSRSI